MTEENAEPKPTKLKLSIDSPQKNAPATPSESPINSPKSDSTLPPTPPPAPAEPQVPEYDPEDPFGDVTKKPALKVTPASELEPEKKPTPPELPSKPAPRIDDGSSEKLSAALQQLSSDSKETKSNPIISVLIIGSLLLILAASAVGILYLISSDDSSAETTTSKVVKKTKPASSNGPISKAKAVITQATAAKEPEIVAELTEALPKAEPTPEPKITNDSFKGTVAKFLSDANIGAVKAGPQARMMLNGKSHQIGDLIDDNTGLRFIGTKDKRLVFKDRNGIFYVKSF